MNASKFPTTLLKHNLILFQCMQKKSICCEFNLIRLLIYNNVECNNQKRHLKGSNKEIEFACTERYISYIIQHIFISSRVAI